MRKSKTAILLNLRKFIRILCKKTLIKEESAGFETKKVRNILKTAQRNGIIGS